MPDKLLHTVPWSDTEELRISVNEFKGKRYLAVRVWFQGREDTDQMFPGKQGINVPLEKVGEFYDGITQGVALLEAGPQKQSKKKKVR